MKAILGSGLGFGVWVFWRLEDLNPPEPTFCRVPVNSTLGFTIRTYRKVGFGRLRQVSAAIGRTEFSVLSLVMQGP